MANEPTVDQPRPEFDLVTEGEPRCLELFAPGGQLMAKLIIQEVSVDDAAMRVIPAFRAQTGVRGPVGFKLRQLSAEELELLQKAQQQ